MKFLRAWFAKLRKKKPTVDFRSSQGILLRPDGSWAVVETKPADKTTTPTTSTNSSSYAPPNALSSSFFPPRPRPILDDGDEPTVINAPPDFFPQSAELFSKLEQCIDLDIISSCVHKKTRTNSYLLSIELPCSSDNTENMRRFKMFIKAMEEAYKFKTVQQKRINSTTSGEQYYLVVFEYDPKLFILKKLEK